MRAKKKATSLAGRLNRESSDPGTCTSISLSSDQKSRLAVTDLASRNVAASEKAEEKQVEEDVVAKQISNDDIIMPRYSIVSKYYALILDKCPNT